MMGAVVTDLRNLAHDEFFVGQLTPVGGRPHFGLVCAHWSSFAILVGCVLILGVVIGMILGAVLT
jgi:hypothetical protein